MSFGEVLVISLIVLGAIGVLVGLLVRQESRARTALRDEVALARAHTLETMRLMKAPSVESHASGTCDSWSMDEADAAAAKRDRLEEVQ